MTTREKTSELLAYMAGIVDGEGCINIYPSRTTYMGRISVYNTSLKLLELFQEQFGGTIVILRHGGTIAHPRKSYHWHLASHRAVPILEALSPYLFVKKRQAEILLAFLATGKTHADAVVPGVKDYRIELFRQIKELNSNPHHSQRLSETEPETG